MTDLKIENSLRKKKACKQFQLKDFQGYGGSKNTSERLRKNQQVMFSPHS